MDKTLDVINLGAEDFIVYYKRKQEESKIFHYGKIVFVILVAFFGASFSIMTYNTDVGIEELFYNVLWNDHGTGTRWSKYSSYFLCGRISDWDHSIF